MIEQNKRFLHYAAQKYKILAIPLHLRHFGDAIVTPLGVITLDEGFNVIDGHIVHTSGLSESTWDKYGVGLFGEKVVMDLLRAKLLDYDSESQSLMVSNSLLRPKASLA